MSVIEIILISLSLAADAFAVSMCLGLSVKGGARVGNMVSAGLYFGVFQALMPLAGFFLGSVFANRIAAYDHWVIFALLAFIGGKMIWESFTGKDDTEYTSDQFRFANMLMLAIATSIDALGVGITFAFSKINVPLAVSCIGIITFALSAVGVKIGSVFGSKYKSKAELAGGIVLVLLGLKALFL
ncbi:MAG: manganese efflux pump MntP family protein [Spirochaetaceae bacterium]|jgi:putative Mn2+ efflux pump MntP|nr:manganese efflux pump MntP family protein [Spirochaetaceae bacterium]